MSLFRRFFYKNPPDHLVEISERVYAFDCCFSSEIMGGDEYKLYLGGIVAQLHKHFPNASFMVFNFKEGEQPSQISDVLSKYDMTVMDYPTHYEGCPLLTLEMIHHFLKSSESWLSLEGQQNVLLMHCERGGWPVLAFMLSGLLLYRKQYQGEQKTLEMVQKQAPMELLRLSFPLNSQPSQLRYLQYISRRSLGSDCRSFETPLLLDCLILRDLPYSQGCMPVLRVYGQDPNAGPNRSSMLLFSTPKTKKQTCLYQQEECIQVKLDIQCRVQGDVVLECMHLHDDLVREEIVFRIMFHTAFVRGNVLVVQHDEMDKRWKAKDQFPKEFKAEVLFSGADAGVPSIATSTMSEDEDFDIISRKEFYEVEEICSGIDGPDNKTDLDSFVVVDVSEATSVLHSSQAAVSPLPPLVSYSIDPPQTSQLSSPPPPPPPPPSSFPYASQNSRTVLPPPSLPPPPFSYVSQNRRTILTPPSLSPPPPPPPPPPFLYVRPNRRTILPPPSLPPHPHPPPPPPPFSYMERNRRTILPPPPFSYVRKNRRTILPPRSLPPPPFSYVRQNRRTILPPPSLPSPPPLPPPPFLYVRRNRRTILPPPSLPPSPRMRAPSPPQPPPRRGLAPIPPVCRGFVGPPPPPPAGRPRSLGGGPLPPSMLGARRAAVDPKSAGRKFGLLRPMYGAPPPPPPMRRGAPLPPPPPMRIGATHRVPVPGVRERLGHRHGATSIFRCRQRA